MTGRMGKTTTELNLRQGPGTQHERLTTLPAGLLFDVLGIEGDWLHITAQGQAGYVHREYVQLPRAGKTTQDVGVRTAQGVNADLVAALYQDTQVMVFGESNAWVEVVALGFPGYLPAEALAYPQIAHTTGEVNLRAGPGLEYRVLEQLPLNTQVHVWDKSGDWYYIADTIRVGYLRQDFVGLGAPQPPAPPPSPAIQAPAGDSSLQPPDSELIHLSAGASDVERQAANIWNRVGGLLKPLADQLGIHPGLAVAVLAVESGGRAFGADGRLLIRFENHIFYDRWGKQNEARYMPLFRYSDGQRWQEHYWRPAADQEWRPTHGPQANEWAAFEFACSLDDTAAKSSISMGGPQIMGFNYATLGYDSVQAMFAGFSASERDQIVGLFTFIRGRGDTSPRVQALQALDFEGFARLYNGPGQAAHYGSLIRGVYEAFRRLKG